MRKGPKQPRAFGFGVVSPLGGAGPADEAAAVEAALPRWFLGPVDHAMALDMCSELADHANVDVRLAVAREISRQVGSGTLQPSGDRMDGLRRRMLADRDRRIREIASSPGRDAPG